MRGHFLSLRMTLEGNFIQKGGGRKVTIYVYHYVLHVVFLATTLISLPCEKMVAHKKYLKSRMNYVFSFVDTLLHILTSYYFN